MTAVDFEAVFERSPNPYLLLDRELRGIAANQAYVRLTATRLEDLAGRHVFDLFPTDPDDPHTGGTRNSTPTARSFSGSAPTPTWTS